MHVLKPQLSTDEDFPAFPNMWAFYSSVETGIAYYMEDLTYIDKKWLEPLCFPNANYLLVNKLKRVFSRI